jgi:TrwC relaxase
MLYRLFVALGAGCGNRTHFVSLKRRVRAMTGGEGYAQGHLQQSDYYHQNRTVEGRWHGRGAELLGPRGELTSDDLLREMPKVMPQETRNGFCFSLRQEDEGR